MRKKIAAVAAAGTLGLAALLGGGIAGATLLPASAAVQTEDEGAPSPVADRLERIREALSGLVGNGTITQEQADAVAETLNDTEAFGPHHRGGHGHGMGAGMGAGLDAAAEALGVSRDDLVAALRDGQTLADVAGEHGVDVSVLVDALAAAAQERLDEAVADGRITEERAGEMAASMRERISEMVEQGMPHHGGGHGRHGMGGMHGMGSMRGDA